MKSLSWVFGWPGWRKRDDGEQRVQSCQQTWALEWLCLVIKNLFSTSWPKSDPNRFNILSLCGLPPLSRAKKVNFLNVFTKRILITTILLPTLDFDAYVREAQDGPSRILIFFDDQKQLGRKTFVKWQLVPTILWILFLSRTFDLSRLVLRKLCTSQRFERIRRTCWESRKLRNWRIWRKEGEFHSKRTFGKQIWWICWFTDTVLWYQFISIDFGLWSKLTWAARGWK